MVVQQAVRRADALDRVDVADQADVVHAAEQGLRVQEAEDDQVIASSRLGQVGARVVDVDRHPRVAVGRAGVELPREGDDRGVYLNGIDVPDPCLEGRLHVGAPARADHEHPVAPRAEGVGQVVLEPE